MGPHWPNRGSPLIGRIRKRLVVLLSRIDAGRSCIWWLVIGSQLLMWCKFGHLRYRQLSNCTCLVQLYWTSPRTRFNCIECIWSFVAIFFCNMNKQDERANRIQITGEAPGGGLFCFLLLATRAPGGIAGETLHGHRPVSRRHCSKSLQGEAPCGSAVYGKVDEMSPAPSPSPNPPPLPPTPSPNPVPFPNPLPSPNPLPHQTPCLEPLHREDKEDKEESRILLARDFALQLPWALLLV